ncbi:hypothetical protein BAZSYMB_GCONTIG00753_2 [Bathymodiolus azoricus thioautotrophic gill symbiont]|uniref:Uncharacterized protein n=1 Tax=Bathymodiolus azoricus thioautotrophic gill symbiont TaxID=235205 RepID=A0A1H6LHN7_9GAMM|nr:hypothetical protein BAZSYMB_GCONTIG00753_2 [Bathymodiolus azoricus thioautotrophic gill symbiont]
MNVCTKYFSSSIDFNAGFIVFIVWVKLSDVTPTNQIIKFAFICGHL